MSALIPPEMAAFYKMVGYKSVGDHYIQEANEALLAKQYAVAQGHAKTIIDFAMAHKNHGEYDIAERLLRESIEIMEYAAVKKDNFSYIIAHRELGSTLGKKGKIDEAMKVYETALTLAPKTGDLPASILSNMAHLTEDPEKSIELLKRGLKMTSHDVIIATMKNNLAELTSDLSAREALHREALALRSMALPAMHPDIAQSHCNLGDTLQKLKKYKEAETHFFTSIKIRKAALGDSHPDLAFSFNNIGTLFIETGRPALAIPFLVKALAIFKKIDLPPNHRYILGTTESIEIAQEMVDMIKASEQFNAAAKVQASKTQVEEEEEEKKEEIEELD
jgi:tetratricopeptide (TPR) repeat protein